MSSYGEWCPVCSAPIIAVTRGIPSMGRCANGHSTDRRDVLRREPADPQGDQIKALRAEVERLAALVKAHEYADEQRRELVRALDVAMHGDTGAAKQASLADLVAEAPGWHNAVRQAAFADVEARLREVEVRWVPVGEHHGMPNDAGFTTKAWTNGAHLCTDPMQLARLVLRDLSHGV